MGSTRATAVRGVAAVFFVHGFLFASWVAHIPQVKAHLGIGLGALGLALLGSPIGSILAMAVAGWLIPHVGSRRVLRIAMVGDCLAGPLLGEAASLALFFLAYMLWGAFQGTLDVAMNTQGITVERAQGRPVMSMFHGSWSLGTLVGAGIGTVAVALHVTLASQLLVSGVLSLTVLTLLTRSLPADDRREPHEPSLSAGRSRTLWLSVAFVVLCAVVLADSLCEGAAADWSAVYLRSSLQASGGVPGLGYTFFALAMVGTRFAGRRLFSKWKRIEVLVVLAAASTVGFSAGLIVHDATLSLIGFVLLGVGCALVIPTTYSAVGELVPTNPGRGIALISGIGWFGFVAGPPLIGQVASATSLRLALIIVPVCTALIAGLVAFTGALRVPPRGHTDEG